MTQYTVAFIGLPEGGKSSIINSLLNKRVLQSGVCRTTTSEKILDEIIIDDDGNKFKVLDLPGICDSEEKDTKFTEITLAHITNANLIFWVSDVNKAFITTHEVEEYNKIKKYLEKITYETGTLYDISIILSKCNMKYDLEKTKQIKEEAKNIFDKNGELIDLDEDTNMIDMVNKVREKFPKDNIMLFNAFGRTLNHKSVSQNFKNFIMKKYDNASNHNTSFTISKFYNNNKIRQEEEFDIYFERNYFDFLANKLNIDTLMKCFEKLNCENKKKWILKNAIYDNNYNKYQFNNKIINEYKELYSCNSDEMNICNLTYLIEITKNNYLDISNNKLESLTIDDVYSKINDNYTKLSIAKRLEYFDSIIYENKFLLCDTSIVKIYHYIYDAYMIFLYVMNIMIGKTYIYHYNYDAYMKYNDLDINDKYNKMIEFEFNILNKSIFITKSNINYEQQKIHSLISYKFKLLNFDSNNSIIYNIIFTNKYELSDVNRLLFMKNNFDISKDFETYGFKKKFDDFVKNTHHKGTFNKMSFMMIEYCKNVLDEYKFNIQELNIIEPKTITYKYCQSCRNQNITENLYIGESEITIIIKNFFDKFEKLFDDERFIILNKLQILNSLYNGNNTKDFELNSIIRYHFSVDNNVLQRITHSKKYNNLFSNVIKKIFSNLIIDFHNIDFNNELKLYIPTALCKTELLFNNKLSN